MSVRTACIPPVSYTHLSVFISSVDRDNAIKAQEIIKGIIFEPEVGAVYTGPVTRIIPIGAFVEIAPGKEGLVHISKLENRRVEKVEDVCAVGDIMTVKFLGTDEKGRLNPVSYTHLDVYKRQPFNNCGFN